jgi:hypothetical protein
LSGSGISPKGRSPKLLIIGALENCKCCSLGAILNLKRVKVLISSNVVMDLRIVLIKSTFFQSFFFFILTSETSNCVQYVLLMPLWVILWAYLLVLCALDYTFRDLRQHCNKIIISANSYNFIFIRYGSYFNLTY